MVWVIANSPLKIWHNSRWNFTMKCAQWYFQGGSDHICNAWAGFWLLNTKGQVGVIWEGRGEGAPTQATPGPLTTDLCWGPMHTHEHRLSGSNPDADTSTEISHLPYRPLKLICIFFLCTPWDLSIRWFFVLYVLEIPIHIFFWGGGCDMKCPC